MQHHIFQHINVAHWLRIFIKEQYMVRCYKVHVCILCNSMQVDETGQLLLIH